MKSEAFIKEELQHPQILFSRTECFLRFSAWSRNVSSSIGRISLTFNGITRQLVIRLFGLLQWWKMSESKVKSLNVWPSFDIEFCKVMKEKSRKSPHFRKQSIVWLLEKLLGCRTLLDYSNSSSTDNYLLLMADANKISSIFTLCLFRRST